MISNGAAVGSIMPAIIAAHIAQSSRRRGASHVTVIIHADAPVMGPYMSRAIAATQIQQSRGRTTRTVPSVARGRLRAVSTEEGGPAMSKKSVS